MPRSLLGKLERLEKIATAREKGEALEPDPLLVAEFCRILDEVAARPEPTIHEWIAWLRERIKKNETVEEPEKFLDEWCREELARLEAEVAKLQ